MAPVRGRASAVCTSPPSPVSPALSLATVRIELLELARLSGVPMKEQARSDAACRRGKR